MIIPMCIGEGIAKFGRRHVFMISKKFKKILIGVKSRAPGNFTNSVICCQKQPLNINAVLLYILLKKCGNAFERAYKYNRNDSRISGKFL